MYIFSDIYLCWTLDSFFNKFKNLTQFYIMVCSIVAVAYKQNIIYNAKHIL